MSFFRKIVGQRLYLSPFCPDDPVLYTSWAKWMNNREIADQYGGYSNMTTETSAKKTLHELEGYRFAIVLLEGDILIGHISLHDIDHLNRNAFLGIVIGEEEHHNKGYGTESIKLLLEFGFKTLNLHSIMLSVLEDNAAAIACYQKVGFRDAGRRREWVFKNGAYIDKLYMDILSREF